MEIFTRIRKSFTPAVSSIIGGVIVELTLGTFYTIGNLNTYMISYLRNDGDKNLTYADSIWYNASFFFGQGSLMIVGGYLEKFNGGRKGNLYWKRYLQVKSVFTKLLHLIICLISVSVILTYYTIKKSFFYTVISYGFVGGAGAGIAYVAPMVNAMKWFPKKKGLVSGITMGGFGLGALIFTQVQTAYLNPLNKHPIEDKTTPDKSRYFEDMSILQKVPNLFVLLGCIYMILQSLGCLLIYRAPEARDEVILSDSRLLLVKSGHSDSDSDSSQEPIATSKKKKMKSEDVKPMEAVKTREFIQLWIIFALAVQVINVFNTSYKAYGQNIFDDDHFMAIVGSLASICNSGGRILWGQIMDKTSLKFCMTTISAALIFIAMTFIINEHIKMKFFFLFYVLAIFFFFSGFFVIFVIATASLWGKHYSGTIYGMLFTAPVSE